MKPIVIVGILVAALGVFVLVKGLSFGSQRNVVSVGDLRVTAEEEHVIPAWAGGVAIAGGLILVGAGMRGRRSA